MKEDGSSPGRYPPHAIGMTHTQRLLTGDGSPVVSADALVQAREEKKLRERKVLPRSDAFKGKND